MKNLQNKILLLYSWFISIAMFWLPDEPRIMRFRGKLLSLAMKECAGNFQVSGRVIIRGLNRLNVGKNVYLAPGVVILCHTDVVLQDDVLIGPNTVITAGNHTSDGFSYRFGKSKVAPVTICRGSWVAANCTITAGAFIENHVLVGANSVVTTRLKEDSIYGGVPAKFIKSNKTCSSSGS